jgi:hypothetical protein
MSYRNTFAEHVRLCILRILSEGGYEANNSILTDAVNDFGLPCARDFVETQLAWLEEQMLVTLERPIPQVTVARLSKRGHEVAAGRASVPGVKKRGPEE